MYTWYLQFSIDKASFPLGLVVDKTCGAKVSRQEMQSVFKTSIIVLFM